MNYIKKFVDIRIEDVPEVGGKNASLGEMYSSLTSKGVKVPNGYAITAEAFRYYLRHNGLDQQIADYLKELDPENLEQLAEIGGKIRAGIAYGEMPEDLEQQIKDAYAEMGDEYGHNPDVAVRSSATAEDLPTASFAGQQESYLNIRGTRNLISTCKHVFASLYTDRAISYRVHQGFEHIGVALSGERQGAYPQAPGRAQGCEDDLLCRAQQCRHEHQKRIGTQGRAAPLFNQR